jgi:hypothetical protein
MAAIDRKKPHGPAESRLAELTREWFADARETKPHNDAELAKWNNERKKWTAPGGREDSRWREGDD